MNFTQFSPLFLCSIYIIIFPPTNGNDGETVLRNFPSPRRRLKVLVISPVMKINWSHMKFMGTIADTLTEAGHEVHFLRILLVNDNNTLLPAEVGKVHRLYNVDPALGIDLDPSKMSMFSAPFDGNFPTFIWQMNVMEEFKNFSIETCRIMTHNRKLIAQLEAEKFDVGIAELHDRCIFAILHRIGAHTKLATLATPTYQMAIQQFGIPTFSSFVPNVFTPPKNFIKSGSSTMPSFWQRTVNFYNDFLCWIFTDFLYGMQDPVVHEAFGPEFPSLKEIDRNISLIFVNSDQFFEMPRPISNKVINVGGLVQMESKELEPKIKSVLDNARAGALFISFGTFTDMRKMPRAMMRAFLRVFARFPDFEFIWKVDRPTDYDDPENAESFSKLKNVHPVKWADQKSILMHSKLRAFVSHCGFNSLGESMRAGVPLLAIPLFADQQYNTFLAQFREVAIRLNVRELSGDGAEELFFDGLDKILHDPYYRANAQLIKRKMELSPFPAREKLVRWVEFAAEFPELNELNLPWEPELGLLAYYSIDAILVTIAATVAILWILYRTAKYFVCRLYSAVRCLYGHKIKKN